MWLYSGPSFLDRPFFEELGEAEIKTQVYKVLAYGANPNPRAGPSLFREGIGSSRVSPFAFNFGGLRNLIHSPRSCPFAGSRICSQHAMGVTLSEDDMKKDANCARDEKLRAQK
jgi:hypothetical protein